MENVFDCLQARGLLDTVSSEELRQRVNKPITLYFGVDPTADSIHLGNWVGIMVVSWFQRFGHKPVFLVGGATARIGDPSGKSVERPMLSEVEINRNVSSLRKQFEKALSSVTIVDNYKWLAGMTFLEFLRDVGKHFRVSVMLGKESVKARLQSEEGISYTEFSYQILQGYDFHHLFNHYGVELQVGGSDQWGNITAGLELIRKLDGKSAFGMTFPLLTRSDGKKFGKTEGGAVWLDEKKFSPYQFYQYLIGIPDADVIKMLKMLTFVPLEEIDAMEKSMRSASYVPNTAQKKLAEELTLLIHGEEGLKRALATTQGAAPGAETELSVEVLMEIAREIPHAKVSKESLSGLKIVDLFVQLGLAPSKSEAHRLIQSGGAYLNNQKLEDPHSKVDLSLLIGGRFLLLAAGKKKKGLIEAT
jgi:tyrosyl-tRNA synthetase